VAPAAPEVAAEALHSRFVWERRGRIPARVADVVVQPGPGGAWIAIDEAGAVWLSDDEGGRWDRVVRSPGGEDLDELPDDEAALLEAESRRDEALDGTELDELEVSGPALELDAAEEAALPEAPDTDDSARIDAGVQAAELVNAQRDDDRALPVLWVDPADGERVLMARADGVWRSTSAGRSWEHLRVAEPDDPAITAFLRAPDGALAIGTTDGVRLSVDDGATWLDAEDATDGARVRTLASEAGVLWAGTDRGLFRSNNGLSWVSVPLPGGGGVRAIVPDPQWEGGFWVASAQALLRTDDDGATFYQAGRQPLRGLREIVHLDEPGHLLAISEDGVWESMDGGVAWATADRRLAEPDVRALAFSDVGPVIATPGGVWRMVAPREVTRAPRQESTMALSDAIEVASRREGLDLDLLSLSRIGLAAKLAPVLELRFDYGQGAARAASYVSYTTVDSFDDDWAVGARFCWGACSTTVTVSDFGTSYEADVEYDSSFYVFDGQVFDEGEPVAAAANVAQAIRSYRRYLADHVADAWLARVQVSRESAAVRSQPLRDQVHHALQLQELDARLDAMTDGAFSRSISRSSTSPEDPR
jgi:hypothetical protein